MNEKSEPDHKNSAEEGGGEEGVKPSSLDRLRTLAQRVLAVPKSEVEKPGPRTR